MLARSAIMARGALVIGLLFGAAMVSCAKAGDGADGMDQRTVKSGPGDTVELDARRAIQVDEVTRLAVLGEMRAMLRAVQGVVGGAAIGDTAAVRASAVTAGMKAAVDMNPTIAQQLGPEFVQLGMRTHMAFDSLATEPAVGKDRDVMLRRLAGVMGTCVGCHEQFRLVTGR